MKRVIIIIAITVFIAGVSFLYRILTEKSKANKDIPDDRYPLF